SRGSRRGEHPACPHPSSAPSSEPQCTSKSPPNNWNNPCSPRVEDFSTPQAARLRPSRTTVVMDKKENRRVPPHPHRVSRQPVGASKLVPLLPTEAEGCERRAASTACSG